MTDHNRPDPATVLPEQMPFNATPEVVPEQCPQCGRRPQDFAHRCEFCPVVTAELRGHERWMEENNFPPLPEALQPDPNIERRVRAIFSYYSDVDLAAHLAAASDGGPTYSQDGVVRPVWINHKLVASIRSLQVDMGLAVANHKETP